MGNTDKPRKSIDSNEPNGLSRRQFLEFTSATIVAGVALGMRGASRQARAGSFSEYLKYDGPGLADLVRWREVKPEELLDVAIARIDTINPKLNAEGLPIGVQFAGCHAEEAALYRLAGQLEKARPWRDKVPSMAS